jgi:CO/xanthine dehydrogenase Mo-binding subunit
MVAAAEARVGDWLGFADERVTLRVGKVELGQGVLHALALIAAEELDVAPGRIDVISGDTALTPDDAPTVGSMSVTITGPMVRRAAASARALFLAALPAGLQGRVEIEDGEFRAGGAPMGVTYWTLAPQVGLDVAVDPSAPVKAPDDYRIVGGRHGRDLRRQVSGGAFIHDLELPGMLHARMVRPPHMLAELATPPVIELPADAVMVQDGAFLGVIAPREEAAVHLAERLERAVVWRDRETPDPDPWNAIVGANVAVDAPAMSAAGRGRPIDVAVSRRFLSHASVGLCCAIALWEGERLTVWCHSQGVVALKEALARLVALPLGQIRVNHAPGAGC